MFANVATWRLTETFSSRAGADQFLRRFMTDGIEIARNAGVLDVVMVEIEPDQLVAISLLESEEDALEAATRLGRFVDERYADRLTTLSRVTGRAFDPHQLHGGGDAGSQRAATSGAMHASLVTWKLDPSTRTDEAVEQFLNGIWERYAPRLQQLGLLDVVVIRTGEDSILAVRLYTDRVEHEAAYREAVARVNEMLTSKATFVSKREGRAFDVPQLLGTLE